MGTKIWWRAKIKEEELIRKFYSDDSQKQSQKSPEVNQQDQEMTNKEKMKKLIYLITTLTKPSLSIFQH